jgi:hypothetical protein
MGDGEEEYNAGGQDDGIKEQGCHRCLHRNQALVSCQVD